VSIVACYDDRSLYVDLDKRQVLIEGKTDDLCSADYDVLTILISHRGQALSPERLIDLAAWDDRELGGSRPDEVRRDSAQVQTRLD